MKIKKILLYIVTGFTIMQQSKSDPIISFFFRPYPVMLDEQKCYQLSQSLKDPGLTAQYCKYGILDRHIISGIFVTYGGYLNVSNELGNVTFPLSQSKPIIKLLVTNRIVPVMTAGNTVGYWKLEDNATAQAYTMEKQTDDKTHIEYWKTTKSQLEDASHIPVESIIVITKPDNVYVPEGATPVVQNPNFILPDVYVKVGENQISNSLYMLNLIHLFSPVRYLFKQDPARYMQLVDPTM